MDSLGKKNVSSIVPCPLLCHVIHHDNVSKKTDGSNVMSRPHSPKSHIPLDCFCKGVNSHIHYSQNLIPCYNARAAMEAIRRIPRLMIQVHLFFLPIISNTYINTDIFRLTTYIPPGPDNELDYTI